MKINGAYKFRTKATINKFMSTYIKIEFYSGEDKITPDEYAEILTGGFVNNFYLLASGYYASYLEGSSGYYSSNINFSTNIKITVIGVNDKGKVIFSRTFDNCNQYSLLSEDKVNEMISAFDYIIIPYSNSIPLVNIFPEVNPDNTFSVYGAIIPNSPFLFFPYSGEFYNSPRRRRNFNSLSCYYPTIMFKDGEPLVEIGTKEFYPDQIPVGRYGDIFYLGNGAWWGNSKGGGSNINARMFIFKYPDIETSIFPPNYIIDFENTLITTNTSLVLDPLLKDSKTGELFYRSIEHLGDVIHWEFFLGDTLIKSSDYESSGEALYYDDFPLATYVGSSLWVNTITHFCYDKGFYTISLRCDNDSENTILSSLTKNIVKEHGRGFGVKDSIYSVLAEGKTGQESNSRLTKILPEFLSALIESYPDKIFPNKNNMYLWDNLICPELHCYSSSTKTLWVYSNSIFIPDEFEWTNKEV